MVFNRRGSIWDDMEREFSEMERMMERMMEGMRRWDWSRVPANQPIYYGVSVDVGADGIPRVQQFGNVRPGMQDALESNVREPFVTSFFDEERGQVRVTAEMPGIEKKDVRVEATPDALILRAEGRDRRYEKAMRLPVPVDEDSARARYHNGVLEITLDARKHAKPRGKPVKID